MPFCYFILFAAMLACPGFAILVLTICTICGILKLMGVQAS